jgi:hypothetical protein
VEENILDPSLVLVRRCLLKIWKHSDPSEALITTKLQENGTQFSTLNSVGINDPEGPEKYNTEVKYGATFHSCHTALDTCCCEV